MIIMGRDKNICVGDYAQDRLHTTLAAGEIKNARGHSLYDAEHLDSTSNPLKSKNLQ